MTHNKARGPIFSCVLWRRCIRLAYGKFFNTPWQVPPPGPIPAQSPPNPRAHSWLISSHRSILLATNKVRLLFMHGHSSAPKPLVIRWVMA